MLDALPDDFVRYSASPVFTHDSAPAKLCAAHKTKHGAWGLLKVLDGELDYVIPGPPEERRRLHAGANGVIEPAILHYVTPIGHVRFTIEFYRRRVA